MPYVRTRACCKVSVAPACSLADEGLSYLRRNPLKDELSWEETLGPYDRNHDGAALGPSLYMMEDDKRTLYPHTITGSVMLPNDELMKQRQHMLHTTYLYLAVAVAGCMAGAWLGSHSVLYLSLFAASGWLGWIGILVLINIMPSFTLSIGERKPRLAVPLLALNGFVSGLALAPLVFVGLLYSGAAENLQGGGDIISTALIVTGAIFASITAYVHVNKTQFRIAPALMSGIFGFAIICVPLNMLFQSSALVLFSSAIVGLLGGLQLAWGTSKIVNDQNFTSPTLGALILFAGVFNTFNAVLQLLLAGGRR